MAGYPDRDHGYQLWVTDLQLIATNAPSGQKIITECLEIAEMLIKKNISYGDSALSPIRIYVIRLFKHFQLSLIDHFQIYSFSYNH